VPFKKVELILMESTWLQELCVHKAGRAVVCIATAFTSAEWATSAKYCVAQCSQAVAITAVFILPDQTVERKMNDHSRGKCGLGV